MRESWGSESASTNVIDNRGSKQSSFHLHVVIQRVSTYWLDLESKRTIMHQVSCTDTCIYLNAIHARRIFEHGNHKTIVNRTKVTKQHFFSFRYVNNRSLFLFDQTTGIAFSQLSAVIFKIRIDSPSTNYLVTNLARQLIA